jgi:RNA polymerase sigma-70 factor, ECF subfamily
MPAPDTRSDLELVEAANRGDEHAMAAIYLRYRDWALRLAWRFTRDHELAADVVQDAFIYLIGKFGQRGGLILRGRLTTLLYPAVRNLALAARRKRGPLQLHEEGPARAEDSHPASAAAPLGGGDLGQEEHAELARLLDRLSDGQREVLLMRVVDEMEVAEIATALGIPPGTVKSRLYHALAILRTDQAARQRLL